MVVVMEFDNKVFSLYNTAVSSDCWVVKAKLQELLHIYRDTVTGIYLRRFYALAKLLTPDHPDPENIVFYFVFKKKEHSLGHVTAYVVFKHFEHSHISDLLSIIDMARMLSSAFDTDEVYLQEFNANGEWMILTLYIDSSPNIIARLLKHTNQPVEKEENTMVSQ